MNVQSLSVERVHILFRESFRHASADRNQTESLWVVARDAHDHVGYGESCPRPYVTGETLATAQAFCERQRAPLLRNVHDLDSLVAWVHKSKQEIDAQPAAWCALELALLDLIGKCQGQSVEALLGVMPVRGPFRYTAVLGDASPPRFANALERYVQAGFSDFKVKLSGDLESDQAKADAMRTVVAQGARVRYDANNVWGDRVRARDHLRALDCPFIAVEEPLEAGRYSDLAWLSEELGVPIILDESLLRAEQLRRLPGETESWIVNLRVSKMGGLIRALETLAEARSHGLRVVVGAHVGETSLLARAALTLAQSAETLLVAQEGAFGTWLLARDVCTPRVMFGAGGLLEPRRCFDLKGWGFGLDIRAPATGRPLDSSHL